LDHPPKNLSNARLTIFARPTWRKV